MKKKYTHITFVIDRSGSMQSCWTDVVGGYKTFVGEQKKGEGDCTFTLVAFDNAYDVPLDFSDIKLVTENLDELKIAPRGGTALYDAIGRAISDTGAKLAALAEDDRPEKVIVVVQTDGQENCSHEYSSQLIKNMIKLQEETYNWSFMFLGANKEVCMSASTILGFNPNSVAHYSSVKTGDTIQLMSKKLTAARSATDSVSYKAAVTYSDEDLRQIQ
jgi:hypothetical protein